MAPEPRVFVVRRIDSVRETPNGNRYLACDTDLGPIAFWGKADNSRNMDQMRTLALPARVRAGCIRSKWSQHKFWVPESADVSTLVASNAYSGTEEPRRARPGAQHAPGDRERANRADAPHGDERAFDAYSVLGVARGATAAEIHAAYLSRMKQYHPDQVAHLGPELRELAHRKAQEINRAYERLRSPWL